MLQSKSLRTTKDICNGAGKWTQTHKSYCSRWPARPQFNSPGWKQVRHFLYISLRDHLLFLCLTWLTWDHALKQAAEQITEHKLLEKLVQVGNEKLSWKLFSVRRYWGWLLLKAESSLLMAYPVSSPMQENNAEPLSGWLNPCCPLLNYLFVRFHTVLPPDKWKLGFFQNNIYLSIL